MSVIGVTICLDTDAEEHGDLAYLDDTVQKNWISEKLASTLGLQASPHTDKVSADWHGRNLQSVGVVTFSWFTSDKALPNSYTTTFHVAEDDSVHIIFGNELLSKEPRIRDPENGVLILTSSKEGTKAQQTEIVKTQENHDAKVASRPARLAEAKQALKAKGNASSQAGSHSVGRESSAGSGR